ncbi:olfactory receptor 6F1-like isoform X3 [Parus major]|uniref:olfactory receptor 6F1-like isoform X3 n=1 Tax=Parus major TaxID=9157 RepID=UPI00144456BA|nr:olfactory receptor 6F1-like isoform X3 [Parus major]
MERKQGQAVAISLNQGDHGYLGRTVHEKMSFGSFQLANLTDLSIWKDMVNGTSVEEFILLGFPGTWQFRVSFVVAFALMYTLTVIGNASVIALVWRSSNLHTPMYFFLCNLSFLEIWYTTGVVPKAIGVMLGTSQTISFSVCILQLFFLLSLGSTECFLLSVMAYDRYLAICYPLSDTWPVELATFLISIIVVVASCVVTLVSYVYIISSILRIQSAHGRKKAFSTCSAHLSVVTIWYGSTIFLYVKPSAQNSLDLNKIVNTFNTVVTPLLNPFIYTLRNKEVKLALGRAFQKK